MTGELPKLAARVARQAALLRQQRGAKRWAAACQQRLGTEALAIRTRTTQVERTRTTPNAKTNQHGMTRQRLQAERQQTKPAVE
jgi:hypothetical protein